jgi:hypothetical protein
MNDLSRRQLLPLLLGTGIAVPLVPKLLTATEDDLKKIAQPGKLVQNTPREWHLSVYHAGWSSHHGFCTHDLVNGLSVKQDYEVILEDGTSITTQLVCISNNTDYFVWYAAPVPEIYNLQFDRHTFNIWDLPGPKIIIREII